MYQAQKHRHSQLKLYLTLYRTGHSKALSNPHHRKISQSVDFILKSQYNLVQNQVEVISGKNRTKQNHAMMERMIRIIDEYGFRDSK